MKINIKNLKGEIFSIEAEPTDSVLSQAPRSQPSNKKLKPIRAFQQRQ